MSNGIRKAILGAVHAHPGQMSPVLLEHLLCGLHLGQRVERVRGSSYYGALRHESSGDVALGIITLVEEGALVRVSGFYPALRLTELGEKEFNHLG